MLEQFRTERLQAFRLGWGQEEMVAAIHSDEKVMASHRGCLSAAENHEWMGRQIDIWDQHGFGLWAFLDGGGELVGRGGLLPIELFGNSEVELNYSVASRFWRQGYATEMATAALGIGFEQLKVESIIAFTRVENAVSRGVMAKVGMTFERFFALNGIAAVLYRLRRKKAEADGLPNQLIS